MKQTEKQMNENAKQQRTENTKKKHEKSEKHETEKTKKIDCIAIGVGPMPPKKELEAAYKRLARKWHPDKNGGTEEAKQRFQY